MKKSSLTVPEQQDLWDRRVSLIAEAVAARPDLPTPPDEARRKMLAVIEGIAGGDRWGVALEKAGWTWKDFSVYTWKNQSMIEMLRLIEEYRKDAHLRKLEDEAERRAVEGVEEDVFSPHGKKVGKRRVYSDTLLVKLLKATAPEKYADSPSGAGGGLTLNVNFGDLRAKPEKTITVEEVKP
ncbi:MAG TPA: hypothetical protein PLL15_10325 [Syntrophales bacterium]|nr:hypothetical protein [Syntrophales bacterium]